MIGRRLLVAGAIASVLLALPLLGSDHATAKKKGKRGGSAEATVTTPQPIPDRAGFVGPEGVLRSTITFGKRYKAMAIGDVNVTIQTLGATATAAEDLNFRLRAPRGNTVDLVAFGLTGSSIGPLTFDDETPIRICFEDMPPCSDPDTLPLPFIGTAQASSGFLSALDGGPVRGTWTLTVLDGLPMETSILSMWKLSIAPRRPVK
jgi:hypothetical protein